MEVTLTLRAVSGYWTPQMQTAYTNTDLVVKLEGNNQIKNKAVLWFNGAAFLFDENNTLTVPAGKLKEVNICELHDKGVDGKILNKWQHIETLILNLEKLDKAGEQRLLTERKFWDEEIRRFIEELSKSQEENKRLTEKIGMLATEIVSQAKQIEEMRKDIAALKNEPLV